MNLVEALRATDAKKLIAALGVCASHFRDGSLDAAAVAGAVERLGEAARHRSPKVRVAVAETLRHAPDTCFERLIGPLLEDRHADPATAARRSWEERSKRRLTQRRHEKQAADAKEALAEIKEQYGANALRLAVRVRDRAPESLMLRMRHEIAKVADTFTSALDNLDAEAGRPVPDADVLHRESARARGAYELFMKIVDSVQNLSRVPRATFKAESVRALVDEAVDHLRARAGQLGPRLRIEFEVAASITVDADRGLLLQAFANILQNAVEAYPPQGNEAIRVRIEAALAHAGTQVVVTFRDWGSGISDASMPHVGVPFRSSKGGSMRGLGVANVRKMVESVHGGELALASERGTGTTVTVVLPRKQGGAS